MVLVPWIDLMVLVPWIDLMVLVPWIDLMVLVPWIDLMVLVPWIDLMVLVPWAKIHHMEKNIDALFRVNKIAIPKNREVPRMNNSMAYSPSCPCFSKTESTSQLVLCFNHVNTNSEMLLHLTLRFQS